MLTFKHYVAPSAIEGLGLFAGEDLAKDALLWTCVPGYDVVLTKEKFQQLPKAAQDYILHYGWLERKDGLYYCSVDGEKYANHSTAPNTYMDEKNETRALVAIPKGTEITLNYLDFDETTEYKLRNGAR